MASCQAYQSNPSYCSYQKTNKKRVYQVDENTVENQLKGFYTTFDKENDNVIYSDKDFDKIAINFVGIEALCIKCCATFLFRLKLHNHLKNNYLEMILPVFFTQVASSIPIIASKTIHQSFGSGLAFRG